MIRCKRVKKYKLAEEKKKRIVTVTSPQRFVFARSVLWLGDIEFPLVVYSSNIFMTARLPNLHGFLHSNSKLDFKKSFLVVFSDDTGYGTILLLFLLFGVAFSHELLLCRKLVLL